MSVNEVRRVAQERAGASTHDRLQFLKRLHESSSYQRVGTAQAAARRDDGLATTQEAQREFAKALQGMSDEDRAAVLERGAQYQQWLSQNTSASSASSTAGESSSGGTSAVGSSTSNALGQSSSASEAPASSDSGMSAEQAQQMAEQFYNDEKAQGSSDQQIMDGLQQAYANATDTVAGIAQDLQLINEAKETMSADLSELRVIISDGDYPTDFTYWDPDTNQEVTVTLNTQADAENLQEDLEDKQAVLGNDAQLTQLELQDALQKQVQALTLMSNIMKMMHDAAMSIINNTK